MIGSIVAQATLPCRHSCRHSSYTLNALPRAPPDASAVIDRHVAAGWEKAKVQPAAPADDADFLRRVYLDIAGRIPGVTEARQFLDDKRPDKRQRIVEQLLASPNYANHFTDVWRALLLPETATSIQAQFQRPAFQGWLREQLIEQPCKRTAERRSRVATRGPCAQ